MSDAELPSYRIRNTLLQIGFLYPIIKDTLDTYERGEDISESPFIKWGHSALERGIWWYGVNNALPSDQARLIQKRQRRVINLYLSMKNSGYNDSVISIFFDDDGHINVYDGFHRLCIMKYLGIEEMVNCHVSSRKSAFPLVERLIELNSGKNIYQPCDDERLKDFNVWRKNSPQRLHFVLRHTTGETVLDIGCAEGYFSRELAKRGYLVTAVDKNGKRLSVARYLSTINNLDGDYHVKRWQDYMVNKGFHNVLYLSIFHHDLLAAGVAGAFKQLELFRGKTKRLFFESPISSKKISWTENDKKALFDFTEEEFKAKIEEATGMVVTDIWRDKRPLFLLEAP